MSFQSFDMMGPRSRTPRGDRFDIERKSRRCAAAHKRKLNRPRSPLSLRMSRARFKTILAFSSSPRKCRGVRESSPVSFSDARCSQVERKNGGSRAQFLVLDLASASGIAFITFLIPCLHLAKAASSPTWVGAAFEKSREATVSPTLRAGARGCAARRVVRSVLAGGGRPRLGESARRRRRQVRQTDDPADRFLHNVRSERRRSRGTPPRGDERLLTTAASALDN